MTHSPNVDQQLSLFRVAIYSFGAVLLAVAGTLYFAADSTAPARGVLWFSGLLLVFSVGGFGIHLARPTRIYRDWTGLSRLTAPVFIAGQLARLFLSPAAAEPLVEASFYIVLLYMLTGAAVSLRGWSTQLYRLRPLLARRVHPGQVICG